MTAGRARVDLTLGVLLIATFIGQFDSFAVRVAAPSVQADLQAGEAGSEIFVAGHAGAAVLALTARVGARLVRRYGTAALIAG